MSQTRLVLWHVWWEADSPTGAGWGPGFNTTHSSPADRLTAHQGGSTYFW